MIASAHVLTDGLTRGDKILEEFKNKVIKEAVRQVDARRFTAAWEIMMEAELSDISVLKTMERRRGQAK